MSRYQDSIEVGVPLRTAYNQWTQFETFPKFMEGVEEVRQLDDRHIHWRARIAGKAEEWDAEIVEQEPDKSIAWRSTSGAANDGRVIFEPVSAERTKISVDMVYEPRTITEKAGDTLGFLSRRVHDDLENFKRYIEGRGAESGAWRSSV